MFWVDHFAHRRMGTWQAERFAAQLAYDLPVDFVAAAPWVRDALADLRPDARCVLVTSGAPEGPSRPRGPRRTPPPAPRRAPPRPRRRATRTAPRSLAHGRARREEAGLGGADVVLMLSDVDGVLGAPLAGFAAGATAVVGPAHDAADLVEHGENGFVADADDPRGAARFLDLLAPTATSSRGCRRPRARPRRPGRAWSSRRAELRAALERLSPRTRRRRPPGPSGSWATRSRGAAVFGQEHATLTAEVHRLRAPAAAGQQRVAAALKRRAKARLKG